MENIRLNRGITKLNELIPGGEKNIKRKPGDIDQDIGDYVLEFIFGDLYTRDGLELKTKQIITITSLAVLGYAKPQLCYHIKAGLNIGLTRKEIIDIFIHISGYAGFPAANMAIATAKEVFKELDEAQAVNVK